MIKSIKELWIGDYLRLNKSGQIGKFSGVKPNGKIIVKTDKSTIITVLSNVSKYNPPKEEEVLEFNDEEIRTSKLPLSTKNKNKLDLHIEVLAPHLEHQPAARILDFQIKAFNDFIRDSFVGRRAMVQVVHGKGEGVLRTEIQHLLRSDPRVKLINETNNGGATDVWLQY